ncbi:gamma-glutamylcyclotransferase family protein [Senegalia massiliensis]|uniref:Gamma-glutamylcyclotransferase n=1 Tax=Senegalia massiliensis TaxID=1720316 RepID=A0A845R3H6_9CLOT|nr:gamma-glutamylcyclotransferase family protein [Senegalia massiliensis]NBI08148.1 gamma-glutamylcyclotransferase [Senegalia massiliensis]
MTQKIFVYGSLMKGFFNYNNYLKDKIKSRKLAKVKGELYHLDNKGYPALLEGDDDVFGELIEIEDFDKNLVSLDTLEGYIEKNSELNEYNRVIKDIKLLDNEKILKAYVYSFNLKNIQNRNAKKTYIPSGSWREYMKVKSKRVI